MPTITETIVPYEWIANAFENISNTSKRSEIQDIVSLLFERILSSQITMNGPCPFQTLVPAIYLCMCKVLPDYKGIRVGVGESIVTESISLAFSNEIRQLEPSKISLKFKETGDLGKVARWYFNEHVNEKGITNVATSTCGNDYKESVLSITKVHSMFLKLAHMQGNGSHALKVRTIADLLKSAKYDYEVQYITSALTGSMRIGIAEATVLTGLAHAIYKYQNNMTPGNTKLLKEAERLLREAYTKCPNIEIILERIAAEGLAGLSSVTVLPGVPTAPMLAQTSDSIENVLKKTKGRDFVCEYKYDGERIQVHGNKCGEIRVFGRSLDETSQKFPDVISCVKSALMQNTIISNDYNTNTHTSFILDAEVVAYDRCARVPLPFQVLQHREKKGGSQSSPEIIAKGTKRKHPFFDICVMAFDLLHLDGECLLNHTLVERQRRMKETFFTRDGMFQFVQNYSRADILSRCDLTSENEESILLQNVLHLLRGAVSAKCEGLMIKLTHGPESYYEPSKRSQSWIKLKKDYVKGEADTFDLVPIAAYLGKGRRCGKFATYLMACYNPELQTFSTVTKVGTGFTKELLDQFGTLLRETCVDQPLGNYVISKSMPPPDVWLAPSMVWEIAAADLSLSPVYTASCGVVDTMRGIALRFPRFVGVRCDRTPCNASNDNDIADAYMRNIK